MYEVTVITDEGTFLEWDGDCYEDALIQYAKAFRKNMGSYVALTFFDANQELLYTEEVIREGMREALLFQEEIVSNMRYFLHHTKPA